MQKDKLPQARLIAKSVLLSIVIPKVSEKILAEMVLENCDNYRLLGNVVGQIKNTIKKRIEAVSDIDELEQLSHFFSEKILESEIRRIYFLERLKHLSPLLDDIHCRMKTLDVEVGHLANTFAEQGKKKTSGNLVEHLKNKFNIKDELVYEV